MGIKNFFKIPVVEQCKKEIKLNELKGKTIAIDIMGDICRSILATSALTDKNNNPTIHINVILNNAIKFKKNGINQIYVFDSDVRPEIKKEEIEKRKQIREKTSINNDKKITIITPEMIEDIKKLLNYMGITYIIAPDGFEAEHLAAQLNIDNIVDYVYSYDSDVLMFKGPSLIRKVKTKYYLYELKCILEESKLNYEEFVHMGVSLGSDFAEKVKGIGIKSAVSKGPKTELNEKQIKAKEYFISNCKIELNINKKNKDIPELINWLVEDKSFNKQRLEKLFKNF